MKSLARRRVRNTAIVLVLAILVVAISALRAAALRDSARLSGWTLAAVVVFLALYNVRKKLPFLPLGSSAAWLQIHIYAGLLTAVLFAVHVRWGIPNGVFERVLALLYLSAFGSGIFGLIISRLFARRLTTRGEEVLYERIPVRRERLQAEVEEIVLQSLKQAESVAIPQFYTERLKPFFERSRYFWHHLVQSERPRRKLVGDIQAHDRFLDETGRRTMREIVRRVEAKDDLDFQFAHQSTLKYWLFAHVPLTYALLIFILFHLLLVYAYSGGIR